MIVSPFFGQPVPPGERSVPSSTDSWVSKKNDRCGGQACVRDLRIPVWAVVNYRRLGASDAEILRAYPSLGPADLEAVWEYAAGHPDEIDLAIRRNEEGDEGFAG
jgi:uncharacterized protein (DUF433 family)